MYVHVQYSTLFKYCTKASYFSIVYISSTIGVFRDFANLRTCYSLIIIYICRYRQ